MPTKNIARRAAVLLLLAAPLAAQAWGFEGHKLIASLAERQLSPAARAEVQRLLAQEPGATMASVSTWADEHRSPTTGPWHYVNFPAGDCSYVPARDCADGACVIEALQRQTARLKARGNDDAERLLALKYVVHFVGDIHQPLHAGHAHDKGGNSHQLQAFGRGSNLHSLWDTGLIMNRDGGVQALRERLAGAEREAGPSAPRAAAWALESCRIVAQPDFYPEGRHVGAEYRDAHEATLEARLKTAAERLAATLNEALGAAALAAE